ncbi:heavy metal transporter [Agromyces bauzanensis]
MTDPDAARGGSPERRRGHGRPARERVSSADLSSNRAEPLVRTGAAEVSEAETVFTRSLMRTQARLALASVLSFVVVVVFFTFVISRIPALHDLSIAGVPLPWLMQAYGFYPIIVVFAVIHTVAAMRTERRFRALVEHE